MSENPQHSVGPLVSVITPCYNSARYIGETVRSVQAQTLPDWEQIVVDDGSSDRPETVVAPLTSDTRVRFVQKNNGGVASARNAGFRAASKTSRYLVFLDADDCLEPTFLSEMTAYMDAHPTVGMGYCDPVFIDENSNPMHVTPQSQGWMTRRLAPSRWGVRRVDENEPQTPFFSIFSLTTIIPSLVMMRRSVYEETPGWDEAFGHIYEDTDMFLQLALRSDVYHIARPLLRYRRHSTQSTTDPIRVVRQEEKLFQKWAHLDNLTPEQVRTVQAALAFRNGRFAAYTGWQVGINYLRRGQVAQAGRFLGGAAKRWAGSLSPKAS